MGCNQECLKIRFVKLPTSREWYGAGASRCDRCVIFISWEGMFCPCCGIRLRKIPRNKRGKLVQEMKDKTRIG